MDFTEVETRVKVIVLYQIDADINNAARPHKMIYQGREIVFTELGLYHPTKRGQRMVHVFDMSDDESDYRLEFDAERLSWTLVAITSAN
ncbi:hypothetical protein FWG95_01670 [Candidatus Saccharibacteria bacterium]|nr:hypothetical protein [Candidatus Saccharibacteria bacterium]